MNAIKISAIVLIAAGILGWVYGGFSYTKETHEARIGLFELPLKDKQTVNVPVWTDMGVIGLGGVLLVLASRKPEISGRP